MEYEIYGIRGDYDRVYKVGDKCRNSHQWLQDEPHEDSGLVYNK